MRGLLEILGDTLLIGCGVAFLFIFISILIVGGYQAIEGIPWVLSAEIGMSVVVLAVGVERYIDDTRRKQ